jgi:hypothetical protein
MPWRGDMGASFAAALLLVAALSVAQVAVLTAEQQHAVLMPQAMPAPAQAVKRTIVTDLTVWLKRTLQESSVAVLVVIPYSSSRSSTGRSVSEVQSAEPPPMQINWQALNTTQGSAAGLIVYVVHRLQEAAHLRPMRQHRQHSPGRPPRAAILVQGLDGVVHMQQLALATAVSKRLRRAHTLSLQYSNHAAMGDSLLLFNRAGVPIEAAFAATSVFRDAFTAIYDKQAWGPEGGGSGPGERHVDIAKYVRKIRPLQASV